MSKQNPDQWWSNTLNRRIDRKEKSVEEYIKFGNTRLGKVGFSGEITKQEAEEASTPGDTVEPHEAFWWFTEYGPNWSIVRSGQGYATETPQVLAGVL